MLWACTHTGTPAVRAVSIAVPNSSGANSSASMRPWGSMTPPVWNSLIHWAPARIWRRIAPRIASGPSTTSVMSPWDRHSQQGRISPCPPVDVIPLPHGWMRGPTMIPRPMDSRAAMSRCSTSLTVRIVVTPPATVSRRLCATSNAIRPGDRRVSSFTRSLGALSEMCTCTSIRPGSTEAPAASTTRAPCGSVRPFDGPAYAMRPSSIRTRASATGSAPVPSMSRPPAMAWICDMAQTSLGSRPM